MRSCGARCQPQMFATHAVSHHPLRIFSSRPSVRQRPPGV